jgi:hypothetical protein
VPCVEFVDVVGISPDNIQPKSGALVPKTVQFIDAEPPSLTDVIVVGPRYGDPQFSGSSSYGGRDGNGRSVMKI